MERLTQLDIKTGTLYVQKTGIGKFESITSSDSFYKVVKKLNEYEENVLLRRKGDRI